MEDILDYPNSRDQSISSSDPDVKLTLFFELLRCLVLFRAKTEDRKLCMGRNHCCLHHGMSSPAMFIGWFFPD